MNVSKSLLIAAIIFAGALMVFGILYVVDPLTLKREPVTDVPVEHEIPASRPESLYWKNVTQSAPWAPRDSAEVFLFDDKMWITGGLNGNTEVGEDHFVEYWNAPHFNDIWNTKDGITWTQVAASSAWEPRRSLSIVEFQDKLWMLGGWSPVGGYMNDIWSSVNGSTWKKVVGNAIFPATEGQLVTVFNGKLWKMGGVNYDKRLVTNDVWYSENGTNWEKAENIPWQPRWDHAVAVFNGKLYLAGGMNLKKEMFGDVWVTTDGFHWELVTDTVPWDSRQGHSLTVYKGYLWLIGRLNDEETGGPNDVWFSRDGKAWEKTTVDPEWRGREDFLVTIFKDKLWLFSGMDADWKWRNDVWVADFGTTTP